VFKQDGKKGAYQLDCAVSTNLVMLKAKMDAIGSGNFNREFNGLALHGWETGTDKYGTGQLEFDKDGALDRTSGDIHNNNGNSQGMRPGDFGYFRNMGVEYGSSETQGENAIYLGKDENGKPIFFGNPIGMATGYNNQYGGLSTFRGSMDSSSMALMDRA
jgi:hypothetical protein